MHRAVEVTDPSGEFGVGDLLQYVEDSDEPITAHEDIETDLAELKGRVDPQDEDPAVMMAIAVATYLAFRRDEATDLFFDGERLVELPGERFDSGAAHGSGCTHSSALAAHLALGLDPLEAARAAKRIASEAVRDGLDSIGRGAGPVDVFGLERRARERG